jgi:indolepyruvate ferredoxin oxidoreductase beta subunit
MLSIATPKSKGVRRLSMKKLNIIIAGVGGQGNVLLEEIIGVSAMKEGYEVRGADTFGASQRGGSVVSHLRLGEDIDLCLVPEKTAHIVVGLEPCEALRAARELIRENGLLVYNTSPILPVPVKTGAATYPSPGVITGLMRKLTRNIVCLDATALCKEKGSPRSINIAMLGVLMGLEALPLSLDVVREVMLELLGYKSADANASIFETGFRIGQQEARAFEESGADFREVLARY